MTTPAEPDRWKYLVMVTGDFPSLDDPALRLALEQNVIQAIEESIWPFAEQGVQIGNLHMRVERVEEFPL